MATVLEGNFIVFKVKRAHELICHSILFIIGHLIPLLFFLLRITVLLITKQLILVKQAILHAARLQVGWEEGAQILATTGMVRAHILCK